MSLGHGAGVVRSGLLLHLDAANLRSEPGDGNVVYDLSTNQNHTNKVNSVGFDSANKGSWVFNGSTSYFDCGNAAIFSPPLLTATIMIKCSSFSTRPHLLGRGAGGSGNFYIVVETNGTFRFYNDIGAGWVIAATTTAFALNTWTHVTVTHDGSFSSIFYNGVQQVNTARVGNLRNWQSNTLQVGSINSGASLINGNVSFVQLYNRALSQPEIQQNFNALRGRYGI